MNTQPSHSPDRNGLPQSVWLDHRLSTLWCIVGWLTASALFVEAVHGFSFSGAPSSGDAYESLFPTFSIAHGNLACSYPNSTVFGAPLIPPVWPLFSGAAAALLQIGHGVPFPSATEMGPHCSSAVTAMDRWSRIAPANITTLQLGYLSWLVLLAGAVAFLRTTDRGRRRWEPTALVYLAAAPPVWMCLEYSFHPQDLMAMGLVLGGIACLRRDLWAWAGVLVGLGVVTQQFDLLVAAPLLIFAPSTRRLRYAGSFVGAVAIVAIPFLVVTSGRAFSGIALGSGDSAGMGGSVLWELHLHGALGVTVTRVLPILASMVLAAWAVRRFGVAVLQPIPLISIVALSFFSRLVFEQNLRHTYYFMAVTVSLILLDVVRGRLRGSLLAWIALVTLAYDQALGNQFTASWGTTFQEYLPTILIAVGIVCIAYDLVRHKIRWYLLVWLLLMVAVFATWPFTNEHVRNQLPLWLWQIVLVSSGIALAAGPLMSSLRDLPASQEKATAGPVGSL
jgi:hypothetical protein